MMKKEYAKPVLEITRFEAHDIITASAAGNMIKDANENIEKMNSNIQVFKQNMK